MDEYHFSLVTPNGQIFEGPVTSLIAPGSLGSFGVLAHHAPFVSSLKEGVLEIRTRDQSTFFAISSGILEVDHKGCTLILADSASQAQSRDDALVKVAELIAS